MLHAPVILYLGDVAFPPGMTSIMVVCLSTSLTIVPLFMHYQRITVLRASGLCLVWISNHLQWACHWLLWCFLFHLKLYTCLSLQLDQALPTDGANCKDSNCIGP